MTLGSKTQNHPQLKRCVTTEDNEKDESQTEGNSKEEFQKYRNDSVTGKSAGVPRMATAKVKTTCFGVQEVLVCI